MPTLDELLTPRRADGPSQHDVLEGELVLHSGERYARVDGDPALWGPVVGGDAALEGDTIALAVSQDGTPFVVYPATGGGEAGPVGPQGPMGPAGAQGAQGPQGSTGPTGAAGAQGAQGPKGDTGAQGPAGTLVPTRYAMGALPIAPAAGHENDLILFQANVGSYDDWWLGRWHPTLGGIGGWVVVGYGFPIHALTVPTTVPAGTGWRKPTATASVQMPYNGSYQIDAAMEADVNAAAAVAVGVAVSTLAGTSGPALLGTIGVAAGQRTQVQTPSGQRLNTAGSTVAELTLDLRVNSNVAASFTFQRAHITARPSYCYGVV